MDSISDRLVCQHVRDALDRNSRTSSALIEVDCLNGMITVTGDVTEATTKAAIEEIVRTVSGIHGLNSEVRIVRHAAQPD